MLSFWSCADNRRRAGYGSTGTHHFRDRLGGFLEGFEDADGETAQAGEVLGAKAGAGATAILIEIPIDQVMDTLYGPVSAIHFQEALWGDLLRR